jgi:hypothetical protein
MNLPALPVSGRLNTKSRINTTGFCSPAQFPGSPGPGIRPVPAKSGTDPWNGHPLQKPRNYPLKNPLVPAPAAGGGFQKKG